MTNASEQRIRKVLFSASGRMSTAGSGRGNMNGSANGRERALTYESMIAQAKHGSAREDVQTCRTRLARELRKVRAR